MKRKNHFYLTSVFALNFINPAFASDLEAIQKEIDTLQYKIQQLEETKTAASSTTLPDPQPPATGSLSNLKLGGWVELNYTYNDADESSQSKGGDAGFSLFHLDFDGQQGPLSFSAAYWWYSYMDVIHHAWVGYDFSETTQLQLGVTRIPFGIGPFISNSWWLGTGYYLGFEDNHDFGLKFIYDAHPFNLQLAFFKNEEWHNSSRIERYAYDVVTDEEQANEKTNQFNARVAYTLDHGDIGSTELGLSGQYGQLYNNATDETGDHWAAGVHLDGQYSGLHLKLQALQYQFDPENPVGMDNKTVLMGALADAYPVAAEGSVVIANVGYNLPVNYGVLDSLYLFNDYSVLLKEASAFEDSPMNITGIVFNAGPITAWMEYVIAKNTPYVGVPSLQAFTIGDVDAEWEKLFVFTIGYAF